MPRRPHGASQGLQGSQARATGEPSLHHASGGELGWDGLPSRSLEVGKVLQVLSLPTLSPCPAHSRCSTART